MEARAAAPRGMDITEEGDESGDDGAGDERGTVEGGGRSKNVASAGQYGKADEDFEDAVEEAAGGVDVSRAVLGLERGLGL